jgi:hypothetical protein
MSMEILKLFFDSKQYKLPFSKERTVLT